jgi:hypothetical protein
MHDFDRITAEYESFLPGLGEGELSGAGEGEYERYWRDSPISEGEEMELAAELLDVRNEQELDHFLGNLISKVGKGISGFANSAAGKALGGVLKQVAKTALPIAGTALGTFVGGPAGGMIGGKLASAAGDAFGLELEGLSGEDRDFERARHYVRFAGKAAQHLAKSDPRAPLRQKVHSAIVKAAQVHAPSLLHPPKTGGIRPTPPSAPGAGRQGGMPGGRRPAPPQLAPGYFGAGPDGYPPAGGDGYGQDAAADGAAKAPTGPTGTAPRIRARWARPVPGDAGPGFGGAGGSSSLGFEP